MTTASRDPQPTEQPQRPLQVRTRTRPAAIINHQCAEYPRTDLGNGDRFVHRYHGFVLWTRELGWLVWDRRRWKEDGKHFPLVKRLAKNAMRLILQEADTLRDNEEEYKKHAAWGLQSMSWARITSMISAASSDMMPPDGQEFDTNPWLLNVQNGTIDLRTGELRPHNQADLITKLVPIEYHPDAQCPRWERFLSEVYAGDEGLVAFIQRAVGYMLTGSCREQVLFIFYGTGSNGKGRLFEVLRLLLGEYAKRERPEVILQPSRSDGRSATPGIARMRGARLVLTSEPDEGARLNEALIKELTGEDRMQGRFLHENPIEFDMTAKIGIAANHKPVITGTDPGVWRRPLMIPHNVQFTNEGDRYHREGNPPKDPDLLTALTAELEGILAWAVRGCLEWQEHGLQPPQAVLDATAEYQSEQDVFGHFLEEVCVQDADASVPSNALYAQYKLWAEQRRTGVIGGQKFHARMIERGFRRVCPPRPDGTLRTDRARWHGLRLRTAEDDGGEPAAVPPGVAQFERYRVMNQRREPSRG